MEQFRQVGEVLGGLKALMVLKHEIPINPRQCSLLYDMLSLAFDTISDEIKHNLRLKDRTAKWKALEHPMKELHRIFKEAELYIRHCMDAKDWWARAITLHMNRDCIELHAHNLLCCFPVVIEAIETAAEISGVDQDDMQKRRAAILRKYDPECDDPKLFLWKFGRQYLVPREICARLETAWKEDRWLLTEKVAEKSKRKGKNEQRLVELLTNKLNEGEVLTEGKLLPSGALVGAYDYFVRRRLGSGYPSGGGQLKEIHWLGENFALRTFYGDISPLQSDISLMLSLSHPNVLQYLCAFYDEDRKEGFLVMELMSKDLGSYIKERCGQRNKIPFTIPAAVDIMLQIARGMEYLHSKKIYLGDLNPSNILLKVKNGVVQAKVTGFGMTSFKAQSSSKGATATANKQPTGVDLNIWLAPEQLAELHQLNKAKSAPKYTEKSDVYSFGMLCFELLTGKVPFEDSHLQGEKMVRNILAGERPLFSYPSPKYLQNLTRKCWQTNPDTRPTFSSICRILRYIKKNLTINPNHGDPESPPPLVDYYDMEAAYLKKFPNEGAEPQPVSQIPFQMFTYAVLEKEKVCGRRWDPAAEGSTLHRPASLFDDEQMAAMDDLFLVQAGDRRSVCSEIIDTKNSAIAVDLRSVISEIPHRKMHQFDQRSFGSESPGKRFFSAVADQRMAVGGVTPVRDQKAPIIVHHVVENKADQNLTGAKVKVEGADKVGLRPNGAENGPVVSPQLLQEQQLKLASKNVNEQKSDKSEILEVKQSLRPIAVDQKQSSSESSDVKLLSSGSSHTKLPEIPEKKILQDNGESNQKTVADPSAEAPEKKAEPEVNNVQKEEDCDRSAKKPTLLKKLKELKIKKTHEKPKNDLSKSEPAKTKKTKPIFSPAASPSRAFMASPSRAFSASPSRTFMASPSRAPKKTVHPETPKYEPPRSPARPKKTVPSSNPAASPSRAFHTCSSPLHSTAHHLKDCSSPMSSPLNTCTRCSRLGQQTSLAMSPQRRKIDHV
ncbi:Protein kinase family protein [Striga hermonthica]|uniref:Protein kinase family protein n=1 Tax=Striga hermonthica TaxID=68872 RepID=A0A9N7R3R0_STRHE|nr:Protein kinase family protein [Striga hermonthica]